MRAIVIIFIVIASILFLSSSTSARVLLTHNGDEHEYSQEKHQGNFTVNPGKCDNPYSRNCHRPLPSPPPPNCGSYSKIVKDYEGDKIGRITAGAKGKESVLEEQATGE
ncbi:hypothetical protein L6164_006544 [Bauhinia variegata]|uniref:Uncharacterized protein n=1 Tax=Bauhinia variegata TaxID=167791 RepID=A0ACB9PVA9_BAUVA|nr:hypothetical protein L6164_006544 [Bauhinia variegata]